jgi:ABC-type glycerol-3-phosphate transport system permease component
MATRSEASARRAAVPTRPATREWLLRALLAVPLVLGLVLTAAPYAYMLSSTFKVNSEIFTVDITFIPPVWRPDNYLSLFAGRPYARWFLNTLIVAVGRMLLALFLCSLAGFAFAKYDFPGRKPLFVFILATMMLPFQILLVPLFLMVVTFGWIDSYLALIVPFAAEAFGIFVLRQYMVGIPGELLDAARIDGSGEFGLYWRIALPLARPGLGVMGILFFIHGWNDYLWPLIVLRDKTMMTVNLGIASLVGPYNNEYGMLLAGATLGTIPILIVFLLMQRQFIAGIMSGALKG